MYAPLLDAVVEARPKLVLPTACAAVAGIDPVFWDLDQVRAVHRDLTRALRGVVEDLGYDPDMLPAPPKAPQVIDLDATGVRVSVPEAGEALLAACRAIPGAALDRETGLFRVPLLAPCVAGLRALVRDHGVGVTDAAAAALRDLASRISADPNLAKVATVSVGSDGRPRVLFTLPSPALADELKRVPSLRWDPSAGAFLAPASRLRELMAVVSRLPEIGVDPSAVRAMNATEAPLDFDGTVGGLAQVPVSALGCVTDAKASRFAEVGIVTVADLLLGHLPLRYLDRSNLTPIRSLSDGDTVGLLARVTAITPNQQRRILKITLADDSGKITATFFNALWQAKRFRVGDEVSVYGKVDAWKGSGRSVLGLTNPVMDPVGADTLAVVPVYPQSAKARVTTGEIAAAVGEALRRIPALADPLPEDLLGDGSMMSRLDAIRAIHAPSSPEQADQARQRLAFDELFRMQAALLLLKAAEDAEVGIIHSPTGELTSQLVASLPFSLTGAQSRTIAEIDADLRAPHPMHRLLQGDVGSGKTAVAAHTLLQGVESGLQGALMAPTEILASQLYRELLERTEGMTGADGAPLRVAFFSNKLRGKNRDAALADLASGAIDIAVGTHALLVEDVRFAHLGVVVVDEQHRFGVNQRAALRDKGPLTTVNGEQVAVRPDMLVMTATPIPRTAALTVFGDLDVSVLDELPPGRTPIVTSWIDDEPDLEHTAKEPWTRVREQISAGRQAYVVCPLVEESEKMEAASAVETFQSLAAGALSGLRLGLVHGQQKPEERAETMAEFRAGELDVLVATTVIEVGVNVPNASVIVILDAQRFGIAQLHQLRGRVGRGVHASSCVLVGRGRSTDSRSRMEALVASTDGFYLSEVDLGLRGHGQVFGAAQSGQSDLRVADLDRDKDLLIAAREAVEALLARDPGLSGHLALRAEIAAVLEPEAAQWLVRS